MDVWLHSIEALPGEGRYSVTFRGSSGDQTAIAQLADGAVQIAPASLPAGWEPTTDSFVLLAEALQAVDRARHAANAPAQLQDVDGGWDVMIGNVELGTGNVVTCAAHGAMESAGGIWTCAECGARAILAS